eukprot:m.76029 g.76029  ORF g.76029 m.76029 type:complete len:1365 (-) comp8503_c0_seq1:272-4366(-)
MDVQTHQESMMEVVPIIECVQNPEAYDVTNLHMACAEGDINTVYDILSRYDDNSIGDALDAPDRFGRFPLTYSVVAPAELATQIISTLSDCGADLSGCDREGRTAGHYACLHGAHESLDLLLSLGLNASLFDQDGRTLVHMAAVFPDPICIDTVLRHIPNSSPILVQKDAVGMTPMHMAAMGNNAHALHAMLSAGIPFDVRDNHGRTPYHHLSKATDDSSLQLFLHVAPELLNEPDNDGSTLLHAAVAEDNINMVQLVASTEGCNINQLDLEQRTPLLWAAALGHVDIMLLLLQSGCDYSLVDKNGANVFHYAASTHSETCIKQLLETVEYSNVVDNDARIPLHWAVSAKNVGAAELLLRAHCDVNHVDNKGISALLLSVLQQSPNCLQLLLQYGANTDLADFDGTTPLIACTHVDGGDMATAQLLLNANCNADVRDLSGRTALHHAASQSLGLFVELLVKYTNDADIKDAKKATALQYASFGGSLTAVVALINAGADPNSCDEDGISSLHWAALEGHAEIVDILIQQGVWVNCMEKNGNRFTPLDYALERHHSDCEQLLRDNGAVTYDEMRPIAAQVIQNAVRTWLQRLRTRRALKQQKANTTKDMKDWTLKGKVVTAFQGNEDEQAFVPEEVVNALFPQQGNNDAQPIASPEKIVIQRTQPSNPNLLQLQTTNAEMDGKTAELERAVEEEERQQKVAKEIEIETKKAKKREEKERRKQEKAERKRLEKEKKEKEKAARKLEKQKKQEQEEHHLLQIQEEQEKREREEREAREKQEQERVERERKELEEMKKKQLEELEKRKKREKEEEEEKEQQQLHQEREKKKIEREKEQQERKNAQKPVEQHMQQRQDQPFTKREEGSAGDDGDEIKVSVFNNSINMRDSALFDEGSSDWEELNVIAARKYMKPYKHLSNDEKAIVRDSHELEVREQHRQEGKEKVEQERQNRLQREKEEDELMKEQEKSAAKQRADVLIRSINLKNRRKKELARKLLIRRKIQAALVIQRTWRKFIVQKRKRDGRRANIESTRSRETNGSRSRPYSLRGEESSLPLLSPTPQMHVYSSSSSSETTRRQQRQRGDESTLASTQRGSRRSRKRVQHYTRAENIAALTIQLAWRQYRNKKIQERYTRTSQSPQPQRKSRYEGVHHSTKDSNFRATNIYMDTRRTQSAKVSSMHESNQQNEQGATSRSNGRDISGRNSMDRLQRKQKSFYGQNNVDEEKCSSQKNRGHTAPVKRKMPATYSISGSSQLMNEQRIRSPALRSYHSAIEQFSSTPRRMRPVSCISYAKEKEQSRRERSTMSATSYKQARKVRGALSIGPYSLFDKSSSLMQEVGRQEDVEKEDPLSLSQSLASPRNRPGRTNYYN